MATGEQEFRSLLWERDLPEGFRPPKYPDVDGNAAFRNRIEKLASEVPEVRAKIKQICAVSPYFLVQTFGFTSDPRRKPAILPFVLYPFQVDLMYEVLEAIFKGDDYFIEKCRDMGASWIVVVCCVYLWLFWPDSAVLLGSFKEERVDRKRGSLMKMADTFIRYLPAWVKPDTFDLNRHRVFMSLVNPEASSSIEGEATNPEFGRGDRKTVILFDELAYWADKQAGMDTEAWEGTADVANCRIALSTPHGVNNQYYRLKEKFDAGVMRGMTLDWLKHPVKSEGATKDGDGNWTSPWLEVQKERRSPEYLAQEVFIRYTGTGSPAFPLSMEFLKNRRFDLVEKIMHGQYGKPFEFVYEEDPERRLATKLGQRIRGVAPWKIPSPESLRDRFLDQRAYNGTPGVLWIFEEPEAGWRGLYIIAADQSEGLVGGDFATLSVLKRPKVAGQRAVQVAAWRGKVNADMQAEIFVWLHRKYNNGFMVPEANPAGQSAINFTREIMGAKFARNCYHSEATGKDQVTKTDKLGYIVSPRTKKPLVDLTASAMHNCEVDINCLQTLVELFNYECSGNRYAGKAPYHDDAAIAFMLSIAGHRSGQAPRVLQSTEETRAAASRKLHERRTAPGAFDGLCV
jgi:hypothetical protein